jgi:hypothetical protein
MRAREGPAVWSMLLVVALTTLGGSGETGQASGADHGSVTGHGSEVELSVQWTDAAQARIDAEVVAARRAVAEFGQYFAEDVVLDDAWGVGPIAGRHQLRDRLTTLRGTTFEGLHVDDVYLDLRGAALLEHLDDGSEEVLEVRTYGDDGVTESQVLRPDSAGEAGGAPDVRGRGDATGEGIAAAYAAVWNGTNPRELDRLYAPGARLADDLLGIRVRGVAGIRALATRLASTARSVPVALDEPLWESTAGGTIALLVRADDGQGCPGRGAVVLELSGQQVRSERRLHAIDDVRRCVPAAPDGGWWTRLSEPAPLDAVTGHLWIGRTRAVVRGGTPPMLGLPRWALQRFALAGLAPPRWRRSSSRPEPHDAMASRAASRPGRVARRYCAVSTSATCAATTRARATGSPPA